MDTEAYFDELNINKEKLKESYDGEYGKKLLPREWYPEIIQTCIDNCHPKPENVNLNKSDNVFTLQFEDEKQPGLFEKEFNKKLLPSIRQYIEHLDENPKHYSRGMVLETIREGIGLTISY